MYCPWSLKCQFTVVIVLRRWYLPRNWLTNRHFQVKSCHEFQHKLFIFVWGHLCLWKDVKRKINEKGRFVKNVLFSQAKFLKDPTEYNLFTSTFFNKSRYRYFKGNWFLFALNLLPWGGKQQITFTWTLNKVYFSFLGFWKGGPVDTKTEITFESICIC